MKKRGREIFIIDDITDYIPQDLCETISIFLCFVLFRRGGTASRGAVRFFYAWTGVSGEVMPAFVPSCNLANAAQRPFRINSGQF